MGWWFSNFLWRWCFGGIIIGIHYTSHVIQMGAFSFDSNVGQAIAKTSPCFQLCVFVGVIEIAKKLPSQQVNKIIVLKNVISSSTGISNFFVPSDKFSHQFGIHLHFLRSGNIWQELIGSLHDTIQLLFACSTLTTLSIVDSFM